MHLLNAMGNFKQAGVFIAKEEGQKYHVIMKWDEINWDQFMWIILIQILWLSSF